MANIFKMSSEHIAGTVFHIYAINDCPAGGQVGGLRLPLCSG